MLLGPPWSAQAKCAPASPGLPIGFFRVFKEPGPEKKMCCRVVLTLQIVFFSPPFVPQNPLGGWGTLGVWPPWKPIRFDQLTEVLSNPRGTTWIQYEPPSEISRKCRGKCRVEWKVKAPRYLTSAILFCNAHFLNYFITPLLLRLRYGGSPLQVQTAAAKPNKIKYLMHWGGPCHSCRCEPRFAELWTNGPIFGSVIKLTPSQMKLIYLGDICYLPYKKGST